MKKKNLVGKVAVVLLISLVAVSLAVVYSFAADKLIVKDAAGTSDVFVVDDTLETLQALAKSCHGRESPARCNVFSQLTAAALNRQSR